MLVERFQSEVKTDNNPFHIDPVQSDSIAEPPGETLTAPDKHRYRARIYARGRDVGATAHSSVTLSRAISFRCGRRTVGPP